MSETAFGFLGAGHAIGVTTGPVVDSKSPLSMSSDSPERKRGDRGRVIVATSRSAQKWIDRNKEALCFADANVTQGANRSP
jgi:hypothetical protein